MMLVQLDDSGYWNPGNRFKFSFQIYSNNKWTTILDNIDEV